MFNNENVKTNGELGFFNQIKNKCKVVFDVGCRGETIFVNHDDIDVHYFDPLLEVIPDIPDCDHRGYQSSGFLPQLKALEKSTTSHFNNLGLSDKTGTQTFYINEQSFTWRGSCWAEGSKPGFSPPSELARGKISMTSTCKIQRGDEYMDEHNIDQVDFLKIDTEGWEFNVLKGFGEKIANVKFIQFEFGGCWKDSKITLPDVISYLTEHKFEKFSFLTGTGEARIDENGDYYEYAKRTWVYCNIICYNSRF